MNVVKLRRKREILSVSLMLFIMGLSSLVGLDAIVLLDEAQVRSATTNWHAFYLINLGVILIMVLMLFQVLPNFLSIYTDEGIKWPSLSGYKLMRWSEVTSVEDSRTFWQGRRVVLKSSRRRIIINLQLFVTEDEVVAELKKRIPESLWVKK